VAHRNEGSVMAEHLRWASPRRAALGRHGRPPSGPPSGLHAAASRETCRRATRLLGTIPPPRRIPTR